MTEFESFVESFHRHFSQNPNYRLELGIEGDLGVLPDPSLEHAATEAKDAEALADTARNMDRTALSFDQRLDLDLGVLQLDSAAHRHSYHFNGRSQLQQLPCAAGEIGDPILTLLVGDPRPVGDRLDDITRRLESVPDYLQTLESRLDTPVARWSEMEQAQLSGLPELFGAVTDQAKQVNWADQRRLISARAEAEPALVAYGKRLAAMPTTREFSIGPKSAQRTIETSGVDRSLSELKELATRFLAENSERSLELRDRLAPKYGLAKDADLADLDEALKTHFALKISDGDGVATVLARYATERRRILDFNEEHQLFTLPADQDMTLLRTPSFLEPVISAGAMLPPASFRSGTRRSLVYLTLTDEELPNHNELSIPSMMIHEGIPGHHLQLATAASHSSVIRRHCNCPSHAEGWTTMLEDYMLDLGYMGELTEEARFVGHRDIARIGARVAIDLAFMTGDPSYLEVGADCELTGTDIEADAAALLVAVTGFSPGRVRGELSWYSTARGYPLSYLAGNDMVWSLKRDLATANPERPPLDLDREFHRIYLEAGNMTLPLLRRVFLERGLLPKPLL